MLGSMTSSVPLNELGQFLRKRRSEPSPRTVGLPETGGHRQVPRLRRREVAHLASISTGYHTRLEQGRIAASAPVLDTLARVLHLDDDERGYLFQLAGTTVTRTRRSGSSRGRSASLTASPRTPAMVQGRWGDVRCPFPCLSWQPRLRVSRAVKCARVEERRRHDRVGSRVVGGPVG